MNDKIQTALKTDPIDDFEKLTGKHYTENSDLENMALMAFHVDHANKKEKLLADNGDTVFSMSTDDYKRNIEEYGFKQVYHETFSGRDNQPEDFYIYWLERHSILLCFDSHYGKRNSGKFYYNWKPLVENRYEFTSSGGYKDDVWIGDHDCREALRHNIDQLASNGEFLTQWVETGFLWLRHHGDPEGFDRTERAKHLPESIRRATGLL